MKTVFNSSNYGNELRLTKSDAAKCSHSGQCDADVLEVLQKPYVKRQLPAINPDQLRKELSEYGAWNDTELQDHNQNLFRWVWISANDIHEGN